MFAFDVRAMACKLRALIWGEMILYYFIVQCWDVQVLCNMSHFLFNANVFTYNLPFVRNYRTVVGIISCGELPKLLTWIGFKLFLIGPCNNESLREKRDL